MSALQLTAAGLAFALSVGGTGRACSAEDELAAWETLAGYCDNCPISCNVFSFSTFFSRIMCPFSSLAPGEGERLVRLSVLGVSGVRV
jgi:hypothetical protein